MRFFSWFSRSPASAPSLQLASNFAQMQIIGKRLVQEEKNLKKVRKRLIAFAPETIESLQARYISNADPKKVERFEKEMNSLIEKFVPALRDFILTYKGTIFDLKELLVYDEKIELDQAFSLQDVLKTACELQPNQAMFPRKTVAIFKREYTLFLNEMGGFVRADVADDDRLRSGVQPKVGLARRFFFSDKKLATDILKLDKKLMKKNAQNQVLKAKMLSQLNKRSLQQDFLGLFLEYLLLEGKFEIMLRKVRCDLRELAYAHITEHNNITDKTNPFTKFVSNYPKLRQVIANIPDLREEFSQYRDNAQKMNEMLALIDADMKDQNEIFLRLKEDYELGKKFMDILFQGSEEAYKKAA